MLSLLVMFVAGSVFAEGGNPGNVADCGQCYEVTIQNIPAPLAGEADFRAYNGTHYWEVRKCLTESYQARLLAPALVPTDATACPFALQVLYLQYIGGMWWLELRDLAPNPIRQWTVKTGVTGTEYPQPCYSQAGGAVVHATGAQGAAWEAAGVTVEIQPLHQVGWCHDWGPQCIEVKLGGAVTGSITGGSCEKWDWSAHCDDQWHTWIAVSWYLTGHSAPHLPLMIYRKGYPVSEVGRSCTVELWVQAGDEWGVTVGQAWLVHHRMNQEPDGVLKNTEQVWEMSPAGWGKQSGGGVLAPAFDAGLQVSVRYGTNGCLEPAAEGQQGIDPLGYMAPPGINELPLGTVVQYPTTMPSDSEWRDPTAAWHDDELLLFMKRWDQVFLNLKWGWLAVWDMGGAPCKFCFDIPWGVWGDGSGTETKQFWLDLDPPANEGYGVAIIDVRSKLRGICIVLVWASFILACYKVLMEW